MERLIRVILWSLAGRGVVLAVLDAMTIALIVWLFRQAAILVR